MTSNSVGTYLRFLRRKSRLSQRDLARILGSVSASQISRLERSRTLPSMLTPFGYQVVFRKPVSEIFPGLFHAAEAGVEDRLQGFEHELNSGAGKGGAGASGERHLEWIHDHENREY